MVATMNLKIPFVPLNWNEYINAERTNKFKASAIKKQEKEQVQWLCANKRYVEGYPCQLIIRPHYSSKRQDLDNFRYKGILDGLVSAGVIENDNLVHIRKITIEPVFDKEECVEIEIKEV
jgi:Holliday junction resolvase RusA-like endonuclease